MENSKKDIEVVIGDKSNLNISSVKDCVKNLRPKKNEKKEVIVPKSKK